jgi:hypothetical protein
LRSVDFGGTGGIIGNQSESGSSLMVRKIIYGSIGALAILAGLVCMVGYAIPTLDDLHRSDVPFGQALLGCGIIWAIALTAFYLGYRYFRKLF